MDFSQVDRSPGRKLAGLAFIVILHVFIVYALVSGLARHAVEVVTTPIMAQIIEEVKPPPPPPKTLPPPPAPPAPKVIAPPPPPFVPPPEVVVQQPQVQNVITAVTNVAPPAPVMPAAARPAEAGGKGGTVRVPAVVDANACSKPEYPPRALRNEETGTVTLQFLIGVDGRVIEARVDGKSGSRELDNAALKALSLCKFKPGTVDGKPEQSWTRMQYVWKLE